MSKFIQGCQAGIPKAIRRSDFNLMKTCFDALRDSTIWLHWRLPVWVVSECWYMVGELARADIPVKKILFRMAAVPKAHDVSLLYLVADTVPETENEPLELKRFRFWHDFGTVCDAAQDLHQTLKTGDMFGELSEYELNAVSFLHKRILDGGYSPDREKFLAAMFLIGQRRLVGVPDFIKEKTTNFKKHFSGKLETINLPWWVYDPSTALGGEVALHFLEKYGERFNLDLERFCLLYWLMEFAITPNSAISYTDVNKCQGFGTNFWLPVVLREHLPYHGMSAKHVKKMWEVKVFPLWKKFMEREME